MVKHPSGVNLEELDFEEVDKEMEAHEATQAAIASEENALEGDNPDPRVLLLMQLEGMKLQLDALFSFVFVISFSFSFSFLFLFLFFFFCGAQYVFGL